MAKLILHVKQGKNIHFTMMFIIFALFFSCKDKNNLMVIIAGSTSVQPYAEVLAEEYMHLYPESEIDIQGGGSSAGITAAISGTADIGMSSRSLKDSEREKLAFAVEIAKDGLAIIVHPDNPIANLTLEQIQKIYTGEISDWNELAVNPRGGAKTKIHIITREEGSGTRSAFEELVMGQGHDVNPKAIVQDSNGSVRLLVSEDTCAIGYISLGLVPPEEGQKPVKTPGLNGVLALRENVINGTFSLYRPFLFISGTEPDGEAKKFIDFIFSEAGRQILLKEGLIPSDRRQGTEDV